MKRAILSMSAVALVFAIANTASAQSFGHSRGSVYVPHTSTHVDLVPHRGHAHAVPHTTTHYDRVPSYGYGGYGSYYAPSYGSGGYGGYAPSYGSGYGLGYGGGYLPSYGPTYVPHRSTHIDVVPHRGHFHTVPHTTTHFDRIR